MLVPAGRIGHFEGADATSVKSPALQLWPLQVLLVPTVNLHCSPFEACVDAHAHFATCVHAQ